MSNPFLTRRNHFIPYAIMWILIAGIHMVVIFYFSDQHWQIALYDALIYNTVFAGFGLAVWFAVRYHDNTKASMTDLFLYHLITGSFAVGVWLAGGYYLLKLVVPDFQDYQGFLEDSLPWRAISGILFYSVMVLIYYLHIQGEDRKKRKMIEDQLQLKIREAEIDRLKAQINPHFLFNSLNSIASLTLTKPEAARDMIVKLSSFLRYSLEFRENELTSLKEELEHIQQYLEIEKVRFGERLQFDFSSPESCRACTLPNMILQPLLENAIKHGVYESIDPVMIETHAEYRDHTLMIRIRNSFDPTAPPRPGKGIGLQNVSNRMRLIYQADNLIHIIKSAKEFEVNLYIPQK